MSGQYSITVGDKEGTSYNLKYTLDTNNLSNESILKAAKDFCKTNFHNFNQDFIFNIFKKIFENHQGHWDDNNDAALRDYIVQDAAQAEQAERDRQAKVISDKIKNGWVPIDITEYNKIKASDNIESKKTIANIWINYIKSLGYNRNNIPLVIKEAIIGKSDVSWVYYYNNIGGRKTKRRKTKGKKTKRRKSRRTKRR